jgi:hypothetical protein
VRDSRSSEGVFGLKGEAPGCLVELVEGDGSFAKFERAVYVAAFEVSRTGAGGGFVPSGLTMNVLQRACGSRRAQRREQRPVASLVPSADAP